MREERGGSTASAWCSEASELLLALWRSGASAGSEAGGWLSWVPREENSAADLVANVLLDEECDGAGFAGVPASGPLAAGGQGALLGWFDGGLRCAGHASAAAVVFWLPDAGPPELLGWAGRRLRVDVALEAEAAGAALAAGLLLRLLTLGVAAAGCWGPAWALELTAFLADGSACLGVAAA